MRLSNKEKLINSLVAFGFKKDRHNNYLMSVKRLTFRFKLNKLAYRVEVKSNTDKESSWINWNYNTVNYYNNIKPGILNISTSIKLLIED